MTDPLPLVPATSAPRTSSCGSPSSRRSARTRPSPSRMPYRPRASMAASASAYVRPGPLIRSLLGELVLVEHALVEPWCEAHVVDVALVEVDATAQLATGDVARLPEQALEEVRRLDRD